MNIRPLTPELQQKAKDELFEDPKRMQQDLQAIKDWLTKQPHINARMDDQWLISFLRGCKYSLERTKEKLDMFYTLKTAAPEIAVCGDVKDPDFQEALTNGVFVPLKETDGPGGPRVLIARPSLYDPDKIPVTRLMKLNQMFVTLQIMHDDNSVIAGQMYVIDLSNIRMAHITQMQPSLLKKLVVSKQDALPLRDKGSHHINVPSIAEKILILMKMLMNEKNKSRFYVHGGDMEKLHEFIPKSILPTEYGGTAGPLKEHVDAWKKTMEDHAKLFAEDYIYKTDESKRPGAPKTSESLFGMEGSFRVLNVD